MLLMADESIIIDGNVVEGVKSDTLFKTFGLISTDDNVLSAGRLNRFDCTKVIFFFGMTCLLSIPVHSWVLTSVSEVNRLPQILQSNKVINSPALAPAKIERPSL